MISSKELEKEVEEYKKECEWRKKSPTFCGLAAVIGVAPQTVANINSGFYAYGKPYTDSPHTNRVIDNEDFWLIRDLFGKW